MRQIILVGIIILIIFIVGCAEEVIIKEDHVPKIVDVAVNQDVASNQDTDDQKIEEKIPLIEKDIETLACTHNINCSGNELCIDSKCGTIANLYQTEGCNKKCNFKEIIIKTSDEDTFTLSRGKGDYTSAGAIEWITASGPDYCQGNEVIVPVKIIKKNLGKIINEEYVTVRVGEKSKVITHPTIKTIKFTFEVKSVHEECS